MTNGPGVQADRKFKSSAALAGLVGPDLKSFVQTYADTARKLRGGPRHA